MSPKIVVVHPGFPGQFGHIAKSWSNTPGWDVRILTAHGRITHNDPIQNRLENHGWSWDNIYAYDYKPEKLRFGENKYLWQMEINLLHAKGTTDSLKEFKAEGWIPDIIVAHPGWLSTMQAKDVFPDTTLVHFCEHMELWQPPKEGKARGSIGFDEEFPPKEEDFVKVHLDYMSRIHMLNLCDLGVSPIMWQKQLHPHEFWDKIKVIHEGVDTGHYEPFEIGNIPKDAPVITYSARSLEPSRGFHHFINAAAVALNSNPKAHVFIMGSERGTYDPTPPGWDSWKDFCLSPLEMSGHVADRIHWFGKVPHDAFMRLMQHSTVHVHFNHPGVLSWSCLEAMGQGKLVLGSNTGPVMEVIEDEVTGLLFEYKDYMALAQQLVDVLDDPHSCVYGRIRQNAQQMVREKYSREVGLSQWNKLIFGIMSRRGNGIVLP